MNAAIVFIVLSQGPAGLPKAPVLLPGLLDVKQHSCPIPARNAKATVVIFTTIDCPIANQYSPEIRRLCKTYCPRQVEFKLAYVDDTVSPAQVEKHLKSFGALCQGFIDLKQNLAHRIGATVTPEAAAVDSDGKVFYRGRIDDLFTTHGKRRDKPTRHDLRQALDQFLSNKPIDPSTTPAVGCFILKV